MTDVADLIREAFEENGWQYVETDKGLIATVQSDRARWIMLASGCSDESTYVWCRSCTPVRIPEGCRQAVMEYITRANDRMVIGAFELSLDSGELRFRTSLAFCTDPVTSSMVSDLVQLNVSMMDRYLPGILSVVYANANPKDAIAAAEAFADASEEPQEA